MYTLLHEPQTVLNNILDNLKSGRFELRNPAGQVVTLEIVKDNPLATLKKDLENMKAGAYKVFVLDDGPARDVTALNIESIEKQIQYWEFK